MIGRLFHVHLKFFPSYRQCVYIIASIHVFCGIASHTHVIGLYSLFSCSCPPMSMCLTRVVTQRISCGMPLLLLLLLFWMLCCYDLRCHCHRHYLHQWTPLIEKCTWIRTKTIRTMCIIPKTLKTESTETNYTYAAGVSVYVCKCVYAVCRIEDIGLSLEACPSIATWPNVIKIPFFSSKLLHW